MVRASNSEDRNYSCALKSQETEKIDSKHREAGGGMELMPLLPLTLLFKHSIFKTTRQPFYIVLSHSICDTPAQHP